jgi:glycosyltransferase involved in cell wall biosynthesis
MPAVSIVVPMYNAEAFISKTLNSILQERQIDLEVIVVNDRSTDQSLKRVQAIGDKRVRVITGPGQGISASLNAGIAAARADIIMRCDADDLYPPGRIAQQVTWLSQHPEFGAVCGGFSMIDTRGKLLTQLETDGVAKEFTDDLRQGITSTHFCTFAVRTEVLRKLEGCRQYFKTAEDIDLQLRIGEICRVWFLPQLQYNYRIHDDSITHSQSNTEREFFEQTARDFQRQRFLVGSDALQRGCPPPLPQTIEKKAMKGDEHIQDLLLCRAWQEHAAGYKFLAIGTAMRSIAKQPRTRKIWSNLLVLALKPSPKQKALSSSSLLSK